MNRGLLIAFAGYGAYACSDAVIKSLGSGLNVFTIGFFVTLFSALPMLLARPKDERWADFWRMRHPVALHVRAFAGIATALLAIRAFTSLPMAEAYTLIFLMPFFVTLMSVAFLGEQVGWRRWSALAVGLAGVIIVIRPGFRELLPGHFAAAGAGLCGAVTLIVIRRIAADERRTAMLGVVFAYSLLVNGGLMLPAFTWPSASELARLAATGILSGSAALMLLLASQAAPANRIAPAQYSQLIWGVGLGAAFFGERPDGIAFIGLGLVALAGVATFLREDARGIWPKRFALQRDRL